MAYVVECSAAGSLRYAVVWFTNYDDTRLVVARFETRVDAEQWVADEECRKALWESQAAGETAAENAWLVAAEQGSWHDEAADAWERQAGR